MAIRTDIAPELKVAMLDLLGNCTPADVVADRFHLTRNEVIDMAANHGYPDPEKMTLAAGMVQAMLDREAATPKPTPTPAVTSEDLGSSGQHVVDLADAGERESKMLPYQYGGLQHAPVPQPRGHPMPERTLHTVSPADLFPDPDNPREELRDIEELASSMEQIGQLTPIIARRVGERLVIVAGHRRHAAAKLLGWSNVDVIVRRDMPADDVLVAMVTENSHRIDLDPIEEARAYRRLKLSMGTDSSRKVAASVGRSQIHISNRLALLDLPIEEQELIRAGAMNLTDGVRMGRVRSGKVRPSNSTGHPHLGVEHPLCGKARARCTHLAHKWKGRNSVGGVACGECWESVIRANEQEVIHAASVVAGRCGICDSPVAPMAVSV